uniref:ATP synthase complex subunit 8 n=1 Tax=Nectoboreus dolerosus TaxID=2811604 RepID=A0A894JW43_9DYTI|nr:ATP synthase F0 subunit 8 [Nectoboreus dolerosus]
MPQMAPMNWLMLYMFFSLIFIIFNFLNYYMFITNNQSNKPISLNKKMLYWKW